MVFRLLSILLFLLTLLPRARCASPGQPVLLNRDRSSCSLSPSPSSSPLARLIGPSADDDTFLLATALPRPECNHSNPTLSHRGGLALLHPHGSHCTASDVASREPHRSVVLATAASDIPKSSVSPPYAPLLLTDKHQASAVASTVPCMLATTPYSPPKFDWSMVLLGMLCTLTLLAGIDWAAITVHPSLTSADSSQQQQQQSQQQLSFNIHPYLLAMALVCMLCISVGLLVLLARYPKTLWFIVTSAFSIAATMAFADLGNTILRAPHACATLGLSLSLLYWALTPASGDWAVQNALGMVLIAGALRTLHVPSLRLLMVLFSLAFLYDAFLVFIIPLLTDSSSPMLDAATASGFRNKPSPLMFRVPRLNDPAGGFAGIGFGDVIIPGLAVTLAVSRDLCKGRRILMRFGHTMSICVGYCVGYILTCMALAFGIFSERGQPALVYLLPAVLVAFVLSGAMRGELSELMQRQREDKGRDEENEALQEHEVRDEQV